MISSLADLQRLFELLAKHNIETFQSGDLKVTRPRNGFSYPATAGITEGNVDGRYGHGDAYDPDTDEEEDELLFYAADGGSR